MPPASDSTMRIAKFFVSSGKNNLEFYRVLDFLVSETFDFNKDQNCNHRDYPN